MDIDLKPFEWERRQTRDEDLFCVGDKPVVRVDQHRDPTGIVARAVERYQDALNILNTVANKPGDSWEQTRARQFIAYIFPPQPPDLLDAAKNLRSMTKNIFTESPESWGRAMQSLDAAIAAEEVKRSNPQAESDLLKAATKTYMLYGSPVEESASKWAEAMSELATAIHSAEMARRATQKP